MLPLVQSMQPTATGSKPKGRERCDVGLYYLLIFLFLVIVFGIIVHDVFLLSLFGNFSLSNGGFCAL